MAGISPLCVRPLLKTNWLIASSTLESRLELLVCALVAFAVSATTTVRMSPVREARRSAVMPRSSWPAGHSEPPSAKAAAVSPNSAKPVVAAFHSGEQRRCGDRRPPTEDFKSAGIGLEADLGAVFIDDKGGKILAGFEIAKRDGLALGAALEGERLHGDGEHAVGGRDLDEVALADERTAGDVAPGDETARIDGAGEDEGLVADIRRQGVAIAEEVDAAGLERGGNEEGAVGHGLAGNPGVAPERGAEGERGLAGRHAIGDPAAAQEHRGGGDGRILGDHHLPVGGDDRRRHPGAQQLELEVALKVEVGGQVAAERGDGRILRERADGGARCRRGEREDRGKERSEGEEQVAHGDQRLSWATFWSISSEAWMDLEFTS